MLQMEIAMELANPAVVFTPHGLEVQGVGRAPKAGEINYPNQRYTNDAGLD